MCDHAPQSLVLRHMYRFTLASLLVCFASLPLPFPLSAQDKPAHAPSTVASPSAETNLIPIAAVAADKRGPVKDLTQADFAVTIDGKPQTIRNFAPAAEVPLTLGVVVDVSRTQATVVDGEQKATQAFLDALLKPTGGGHLTTKAFVMQYARTAELLQDVTDSASLLQTALKEVGTVAPGSAADEDADARDASNSGAEDSGGTNPGPGNPGSSSPGSTYPNSGGSGRGPYGRNGGGNSNGNGSNVTRRRTGAVLYDSLFLATDDVEAHHSGRRVLVLLSDGVDRHSKESLTEALEATQRANTVVYAIYVKSEERNTGFTNRYPGGGGGYDPYGYPRQNYPGSGGSPGSDGTYADPDGRKILERICGETGGHMFEARGKDALARIYAQIADELQAGYLFGVAPSTEVSGAGYHKVQVTLTRPDMKKNDLQVRDGYYAGPAPAR